MTLSIVCSRFWLLVFIFYIVINHLQALRKSNITGHLDLKKVHKLWGWFFKAKIVVLLMFMAGAFILNSWIRGLIGMDNDALDFEILNYLGVENLDNETVTNYPNL
jgi:phage-related holin